MFKPVFSFEFQKFITRRNLKIFLALFLVLVGLSYDGIRDYKATIEGIESFQETERQKASKFMNYTLYGTRGIRLLFVPCPFCVIFNDSAVYRGLISIADSGEGLYIFSDLNGKELFSDSSGFLDFSGIIYLIGCLIAILYGYDAARNADYLDLLKDISGNTRIVLPIVLSRIILLNLALFFICLLSLLWFLINGINLFDISFLYFFLVLVLVITSFIAAGAVIGSIKNKGLKIGLLFVVPFVFLLIIPGVIKKVIYNEATNIKSIPIFELDKLKVMMKLEKRLYDRFKTWKSGKVAPDDIKAMIQNGQEIEYKKLKGFEVYRIDMISKRVKAYHIVSSFFPTSFYKATNRELSSKGFKNFIKFYQFTFDKKCEFIAFYIDRKFYKSFPKDGLVPFIKGDEDLFRSESQLSYFYWVGVFLTLFYTGLLLLVYYRMQKKRMKIPAPKKSYKIEKKKINPLFVLCENESVKEDIFNQYRDQIHIVCLEKINTSDFLFYGIKPVDLFNHLFRVNGVNEKKAVNNLVLMGIRDLAGLPYSEEIIYKIYAAVLTASEFDLIVINDFVKKESRKFENDFFNLLLSLEKSRKKILYLSTQMQQTSVPFVEDIKIDGFQEFPLDFTDTSLR